MRILVSGIERLYKGEIVPSYYQSIVESLKAHGHEAIKVQNVLGELIPQEYPKADLLLDVDCGRADDGNLHFIRQTRNKISLPYKSAVLLVDSHGYPELHQSIASFYDYVFFAVWSKRDLFVKHNSCWWLPNFTDCGFFDRDRHNKRSRLGDEHLIDMANDKSISFDVGFFGSSGGLVRAAPLIEICNKNHWACDVRQVAKGFRPRWPQTADAMAQCKLLFNHGQKHDGPNYRVFESMAMAKPLINDIDPASGMDKLFLDGTHYIGYEAYTYKGLESAIRWCLNNPTEANRIAENAYEEVRTKHTVHNRVEFMLDVFNV